MSGVIRHTVTEVAILACDRRDCDAAWESQPYRRKGWQAEVAAAAPAFLAGWRVYRGKRTQHTYCPGCGPTAPMLLVYPEADR